ncbi:MAG: hypothetical protein ACP5F1_05760 [Thermoplasmata archaeon]|nr:hypothetical protein [Thermoplasmata archaeon]
MIENEKESIFKGMMKEWLDPPYIPVIAFGGAGAHFLRSFERLLSIYRNGDDPDNFSNIFTVYVNTKQESDMDNFPFVRTVLITNSILGVHSDTNGYVEVGEKLIEDSFDEIFETFTGKISINLKKADAVILVAAFGGGMGTGGIKEALKILSIKYPSLPVFPVIVMPFSFETRSIDLKSEINEVLEFNRKPTVIKNSEFIHLDENKKMKFSDLLEEINYNVAKKIMDIVLQVKNEKEIVFKELYGGMFEEEFQQAISGLLLKQIKPI